MGEITLPHLQNMPPKAVEKKEVLQNAEKKKLVLWFLHSVNHTGSPQDESYSHSYFIPGQNNKSSKCKLKIIIKAAHNSRHNTINSRHNQHQYLHFTYLQLRKVCKHLRSLDRKYNYPECWCYIIHIKQCFPHKNQWLLLHVLAICL